MTEGSLLLSIQPEHPEKIFDGTKKVELRKQRPKLRKDDWVLVYVSSPVRALVGAFQVVRIVEGTKRSLWQTVQSRAGLSQQEFNDYYCDHSKGVGIFLRRAEKFPKPIGLTQLRRSWPGFHPP